MPKISLKETNKRREKVWFLMLKGHNPQSIKKTLGATETIIYNDMKYLTERSKEYIYDMAKGTHVLMYQRAIEGIGLTLTKAWDKFNDSKVPEKQKVAYLRLTKDCNESMINLTKDGPTVMGLQHIVDKARRLGITDKYPPLPELTEEQQIRDYQNSGRKDYVPYNFPVGDEIDMINNPDGGIDTSDPNDFADDPKLVTSGCLYRIGSSSYSHRRHKEGEYCYLREKEEKENVAFRNADNNDNNSVGTDSDNESESESE